MFKILKKDTNNWKEYIDFNEPVEVKGGCFRYSWARISKSDNGFYVFIGYDSQYKTLKEEYLSYQEWQNIRIKGKIKHIKFNNTISVNMATISTVVVVLGLFLNALIYLDKIVANYDKYIIQHSVISVNIKNHK